jgi:biotin carboxyl carrier protein
MYKLKINEQYVYTVERVNNNLQIDGQPYPEPDIFKSGAGFYNVIHNLRSYNAEVIQFKKEEKIALLKINGNMYRVTISDQFDLLLEQMGLGDLNIKKTTDIKAPMPGLVLKVFVKEGDTVKKGDNLFVLEAMKMENIIKSAADVTIKSMNLKPGDKVEKGQLLLLFA